MKKKVVILGSTGSIGTQALEVVKNLGYTVSALSAHSNVELLERQAREFSPESVCVSDESRYNELKIRLADTKIKILSGETGMCEIAAEGGHEIVLTSVVGRCGLIPTVAAIKAGKDIALANKETLVCAGEIIMELSKKHNVNILPVDSEHSAIFQCLRGNNRNEIKKILLTASGGPFYGKNRNELENVTVKDALKHPNWNMGAKITVDSATLMNKGLEFIEAMRLFSVSAEQIEVVVHRESIIHSMVEYIDNSIMAQMGSADMRTPIQFALTYPERTCGPSKPLDIFKTGNLTFSKPDTDTFVCLRLAIDAAKSKGTSTAALNAANEALVDLFLKEKIKFLQIGDIAGEVMANHKNKLSPSIDEIIACDNEVRLWIYSRFGL